MLHFHVNNWHNIPPRISRRRSRESCQVLMDLKSWSCVFIFADSVQIYYDYARKLHFQNTEQLNIETNKFENLSLKDPGQGPERQV